MKMPAQATGRFLGTAGVGALNRLREKKISAVPEGGRPSAGASRAIPVAPPAGIGHGAQALPGMMALRLICR